MDQGALIAELEKAGRDEELKRRVARQLAEPGAAAVPGLVAALGQVGRTAMWGVRDALVMIGPPAFDAVVAARARAEKVPDWWELGHVLRAFDERCLPQYVGALGHPMKEIRQQALGGLQNLGEAAAGALVDVLPFLGDGDSYTRYHAEKTVRAVGRNSGDTLRGIRRGGPGHLRRYALTALGLIGGEAQLGERDLEVLERLVRIKIAADVPDTLPEHRWLAVPGATYEGLFDAMGLHDRRPCTLSMGLSAMEDDVAVVREEGGAERSAFRVFVTPELDGWRLVYADTALWEMHWDVDDLLSRISAACGEAQFFFQDDHCDAMVWAVAVDGAMRRSYWRHSDPEWYGEPMEWEAPLGEDEEAYEDNATSECSVGLACCALSLDPSGVGEYTAMRGHGWLAVTEAGVGHGPFTGALRI
ncbi:hypothetical protein ACFPM3_27215 [Streptomyces coeruleoprunus]|uniref:HEAT repeat domain-containing protein n=1 Tax=Streptomyces coeruleoprunus TaxID=285563 RepID=A0ABV9XMR7_9ACTN